MLLWKTVLLILATTTSCLGFTTDLPVLHSIINFFSGKDANRTLTIEELGRSVGQCEYSLLNILERRNKYECPKDDYYILHLLPKAPSNNGPKKPPILVKCLQPPYGNGSNSTANVTFTTGKLLMMTTVKQIVGLLKPIGNATKRYEAGSCVLVFFYSPSSFSCAQVAPHANLLPYLFPTLRVAAIDSFEFPSFNTEFGIVGLPTLLLFHQGRPVVKFYSDVGTFAAFVTRHTGIKPVELNTQLSEDLINGPLPLEPTEETDYVLILAWTFILICAIEYFLRTEWCLHFVDGIKRNWRDSEEAQLDPTN